MISFLFAIVPVLTWLCAPAMAAPPIHSQPSLMLASLSAFNTTISFAGHYHTNISRPPIGPAFPPRADLPSVFFYDVPFSNPLMNLKFKDYTDDPGRNESECDGVFEAAVLFALNPDHDPDEELRTARGYRFEDGDQWIDLEVKKVEGMEQSWTLTYRLWATALTGLNNFRLAYPGLYFSFEVFIYPEEKEPELYLASGDFGSDDELHASEKL